MAKRFHSAMRFDFPVDQVFAAQVDPHYVVWKHEHMASFDVSASVEQVGEHVVVSSSRRLPAELPAMAKRFVGESILVEEVHDWAPEGTDGQRHGRLTASFGPAPMSVTGTLELRPEAGGSLLEVVIHSKADVPLVGGKLETIVGDQFLRALRVEAQLAPRWFEE
jgi:Protein of unknown function (DUF2505)